MRCQWSVLAILLVTPAMADTLDCALIKSTMRPFELTLDWTSTAKGKEPLAVQMRRQVKRKADETVACEMFSADQFICRTSNVFGFQLQTRRAAQTTSSVATYSIDVAKDWFGLGKPFDFNQVIKDADGKVAADLNTSVSFGGAVDIELEGCTYPLTKIIESARGSVRGVAGSYQVEFWYSRDLKTSLYSRNEESDGSVMELRARSLSTSFKPVE